MPGLVEGRGGEDQDRGVDQQGEAQRDRGVDRREFQSLALLGQRVAKGESLDDAGMQVEVMRHHRRADDAERQIEHVVIGEEIAAISAAMVFLGMPRRPIQG